MPLILGQTSIVNIELAELKIDVKLDSKLDIITATINPISPAGNNLTTK